MTPLLTPTRSGLCLPFVVQPPRGSRCKPSFLVRAMQNREPAFTRRCALAVALVGSLASPAWAGEVTPIYFGNGCFWGRQKDFVDAEKQLGRKPEEVSAVAGYAGGRKGSQQGPVCYYYGKQDTIYEELGHAEVVKLDLDEDPALAEKEMEIFATTYFKQFQKTRQGMQRLDPQDAGPAYRNVIGLPGGMKSPLFKILKEKNLHGMKLVAGEGNAPGNLVENDRIGVVYVLDTQAAPFHLAELYHQYHNGIGVPFGPEYTKKQKQIAQGMKRIGPTGCPEVGGLF